MNPQELDRLAMKAQMGDRDAFAQLVFLIRHDLRVFLSSFACSIDMIDDVLQSALVACYENLAKYEPRGTFLAWVKGIARNLMLKELHARSRHMLSDEDFLERIVAQDALLSAQGIDREEARVRHLQACLERLPDHARAMIQQRYYNRMSIRAMARLHQRTETSIAVTLFRIRDTLRQCMNMEEPA